MNHFAARVFYSASLMMVGASISHAEWLLGIAFLLVASFLGVWRDNALIEKFQRDGSL